MAYTLTAVELAKLSELNQLINGALDPANAQYWQGQASDYRNHYYIAYDYLAEVQTQAGTPASPKAGVDASAWMWFRGAASRRCCALSLKTTRDYQPASSVRRQRDSFAPGDEPRRRFSPRRRSRNARRVRLHCVACGTHSRRSITRDNSSARTKRRLEHKLRLSINFPQSLWIIYDGTFSSHNWRLRAAFAEHTVVSGSKWGAEVDQRYQPIALFVAVSEAAMSLSVEEWGPATKRRRTPFPAENGKL